VKDINKSISFYSDGIGLQQVHKDGSNDDAVFSLLDDSLIKLKQITLLDAVDVGDVMTSLHLIDSHFHSVCC
jgi:catechol 2,3-dioxygenase-like lactoylglutathione lyase family enzyme